MGSFGTTLSQLFATIGIFLGVVNKSCGALDNIATWAEESSGSFADQAREDRKLKLVQLQQARIKQAQALGITYDPNAGTASADTTEA